MPIDISNAPASTDASNLELATREHLGHVSLTIKCYPQAAGLEYHAARIPTALECRPLAEIVPLAPKTPAASHRCGPLSTVTVSTNLEASRVGPELMSGVSPYRGIFDEK
ncbi:unnamed protein product [Prorocentrum cordatum]|uniref:Uncharacterized protein n=1 Tax=Prorocentrum cordatum TaxID=2364126 RepID=A0ABN9R3H9_9DINO|nr:unnamed protein product [Polarella glacialis]